MSCLFLSRGDLVALVAPLFFMLRIAGPFFMCRPPLLGMKFVEIHDLPKSTLEEITPELFGKVNPDTLILLNDPTDALDRCPMEHIIKLGGSKGMRFGHYTEDGEFPDWLQYLDHLVIHIEKPKEFTQANQFNEAIKALWFGRGKVHIRVVVRHRDDLDMTELLYSYTPNDLEFWIELQIKNVEDRKNIQEVFLSRRFSTVLLTGLV